MKKISLRDLVKATVHIGHVKSRWCPAMAPYIWGVKNNIHLIDVSKTAYQLERAAKFLEEIAASGKPILWVGTKKAARDVVASHAVELKSPYVTHRWIGGTLTNYPQVKKSVTKLLHYEDIATKADEYLYTKKEIHKFQKLADRLRNNVGGIRKFSWPVGAVVIVDVNKERAAVREAMAAGVPIVALVDTNSDPTGIEYVIPGNDDAPRSIAFIIDYLADLVAQGQEKAKKAADLDKKKKVEEEVALEAEPHAAAIIEEEEAEGAKKPVGPQKKVAKKVRPKEEEEISLKKKLVPVKPKSNKKIGSAKVEKKG